VHRPLSGSLLGLNNRKFDHFLLVRLLLNDKNLKIEFAEDILLTIYNLSGTKTADNKQTEKYLSARKQLYEEALRLCKMKQEK